MSENKNVVERHGCLVCAKIFEMLAVYAPDGRLVACTVTSSGGHSVPDERQPLAVCDTHTAEEIETAHKKWRSARGRASEIEEDQ
jgi:hypothetical protein